MNKKIRLLIIFLGLLVGVLLYLRLTTPKEQTPPLIPAITSPPTQFFQITPSLITDRPQPLLTDSFLPTQRPTIMITSNPSSKREIIDLLPLVTEGYTIEYLSSSNIFFVNILQSPVEQNIKEAERWFLLHDVNPRDPNIIWNLARILVPNTQ